MLTLSSQRFVDMRVIFVLLIHAVICISLQGIIEGTMLCLSNTSGYAVHALSCLRECKDQTCLVRDIASSTGIPKPYLAKIINNLNHHGLVYAKRGYRGGIALSRPPKEISLLQIVQAVEGANWIGECLLGLEDCSWRVICPTHKAWLKVRKQITEMLQSTSLADVIAFSAAAQRGTGKPRVATRSKCCPGEKTGKRAVNGRP